MMSYSHGSKSCNIVLIGRYTSIDFTDLGGKNTSYLGRNRTKPTNVSLQAVSDEDLKHDELWPWIKVV